MSSSTGFPPAGERVQRVEGDMVELRVRGEGERWPGLAGRRHALARPGLVRARPGVRVRHWARVFWRVWCSTSSTTVSSTFRRVRGGCVT
jgi:hypothetical protein